MVVVCFRFYLFILGRWLLESVTKILTNFYKISTGDIYSTIQLHVETFRVFFNVTVCLNPHTRETNGQEVLKIIQSWDDNKGGLVMIEAHVLFIKASKIEQIMSTFAKIKLSIYNINRNFQRKIAKLVVKVELKHKHNFKIVTLAY